MGETVTLTADDGHECAAYRAGAKGAARGGLVVIQEIFGVNRHIRAVCDGYAAEGYEVIAPALFDRKERGVELAYDEDGMAAGRKLRQAVGWDGPIRDIAASVSALGEALGDGGKVGVVGFCWGGSLAWLAAARLDIACTSAFYGGQIRQFRGEAPGCPIELHFGENDSAIPAEDRAVILEWHPALTVHLYPAGHGFSCDQRADFHAESAALGRERTLALLAADVG